MKKTIALSLTLALAGAFTCLTSDLPISTPNEIVSTCSVEDVTPTNQNSRTYNSTKNTINDTNSNLNTNVDGTNQNTTTPNKTISNINENNKGSSPYGINNGNSGVLPNESNTNNSNLDSMVRTNNIDTYKNNTVNNIDGKTYNNNGAVVSNNLRNLNNGVNTNSTNRNVNNSNSNGTNLAERNNNSSTSTDSNDSLNSNTTNTNSTNNTHTKTTFDSNKISNTDYSVKSDTKSNIKTNYAKDDSESSIFELNSSLANLNREMNEKMEQARENISKVVDKTIELDDDKIELLNAYSKVVHCLSMKLAENHFELMHNAGKIAIIQSEGVDDSLAPAYQEMKYTLKTREVCLECLNEALDELNRIFDNVDYTQTRNSTYSKETNITKTSVVNAKPQTKEYRMSEPVPTTHKAHSTPRASFI